MAFLPIQEQKNYYTFYIESDSVYVELTNNEYLHYTNVIALVLTLGNEYWHNYCNCSTQNINYVIRDFIDKNIKMINRDLKIEKIIN